MVDVDWIIRCSFTLQFYNFLQGLKGAKRKYFYKATDTYDTMQPDYLTRPTRVELDQIVEPQIN